MDTEAGKVVDEFQEYVRPLANPTLTRFCTELTGIEQATVDAAEPFPTVWEKYTLWLTTNGYLDASKSCFATVGDWDLKTMLPQESRRHPVWTPPQFSSVRLLGALLSQLLRAHPARCSQWINIKTACSRGYGRKPMGMVCAVCACKFRGLTVTTTLLYAATQAGMLRSLDIPLEGRHHSGIDDCRNSAKIVLRMLRDGVDLRATSSVDGGRADGGRGRGRGAGRRRGGRGGRGGQRK